MINEESIKKLNCLIVAGGANNQLSSLSIGKKLIEKDILYIPDFIINSGGLIYVSSYLTPKKSNEWIENKLREIPRTIKKVCEFSKEEGIDPVQMALKLGKRQNKKILKQEKYFF